MRFAAIIPTAFIAIFLIGLHACNEPSDVGLNVQPAGDAIGLIITDTFTLEVTSVEQDSLRTDESAAALNLLGRYFDPIFGISKSSIYTQFRLPNNNNNFSFGDSPVLDSIVLTLEYKGYYADSTSDQQIEVYRLDEDMEIDSNYFSNSTVLSGQQLFNGLVEINPIDSVDLGGVNRSPHIRLKLDDALGNEFLDDANAASFLDNESFIQFFKGVQVKTVDMPGSGTGTIAYIDLLASLSKLSLYYSNLTGDSLVANFEVNGFCSRFSNFNHDYSVASFGNVFPIPGDNKAYLQSMAGLKTKILIPNLRNIISDGLVSINKAEMVFPVEDITDLYPPHASTILLAVDSAGKDVLLVDILESGSYYGGNYNFVDNTIRFNIARHIQRLLSNDVDNYGLSLISVGGSTNAFRTVIAGSERTDSRMYIEITYSKLD